jgi:hypothetical protein
MKTLKWAFFRQRGRESRKLGNSLAEQGEFELPVPIREQPDENMISGCAAPRRSIWDRLRLKRLVGLYGRQHPKETLPSCAMNDIATDVAATIQLKGRPFCPGSLPATLKRTRNALQADSV